MADPASRASTDLAGVSGAAAATSSAQHAADLAVLTNRDDFLLELGELLGGRAGVHPVDSIEAAIERLRRARRSQVLVIDCRDTGDVRAHVARASEQIPHAVILAFAERQSEQEIAATLKGTRIFAVLPLPLEQAKTVAVLEAALTDADHGAAAERSPSRHAAHDGTGKSDGAAAQLRPQPEPEPEPAEPPQRRAMLRAGVGVAVLALAAGAGWYLLRARTPPPAAARAHSARPPALTRHAAALAQSSGVDTSIVQGRVEDLLEKARRAMFRRHFTSPKGANALVYYRSVLAVDPSNGEALNGLRRVGNVLISQFDGAMGRAHYRQAALALATLELARPADPRIASLRLRLYEAEISRALAGGQSGQAAALLRQAARAGIRPARLRSWRARVTQLQQTQQSRSLATAITNSIRSDEITGSTGALAELAQLRRLAPKAASTQRAAQALIKNLLAKASRDALAGNTADEARWLAAARSVGASASIMAAYERQLAGARIRARADRLLRLVRARLDSGALTRPRDDSAAHYLTALEHAHPTGTMLSAARQARSELAGKLLRRAESEARAGQGAAARTDVAQARLWGATSAAVHSARHAIAVSLRQADQPTAAELQQLAAKLVRTRYLAPSYPDYALAQRISGRVIVQYIVDKKGIPRHVHVISAQPGDVFNRAALDAIRAWRYRPVRLHGHPVQVPVRTLIRFVLPN